MDASKTRFLLGVSLVISSMILKPIIPFITTLFDVFKFIFERVTTIIPAGKLCKFSLYFIDNIVAGDNSFTL